MRRELPIALAVALAGGLAVGPVASAAEPAAVQVDPPRVEHAPPKPAGVETEDWYSRKAQTRSGIALGFIAGGGVSGSSGYPNNATKVGDPDYYSASGFMAGSSGDLLIMYALSDYLNFGIWGGSGTFQNKDWRSRGIGGGFRVEAFPLYSFFPKLKNLGVLGQFGIGTTTLDAKFDSAVSSDGAESFIGTGVFYEWTFAKFLGGHAVIGPSLEYDVIVAESIERNSLTLNLRAIWYGGP